MLSKRKYVFFILFFLSGFSGLIYQSIWSHYLKLFLGHAAYAQTLVLAIFMGGMAIGSLASGFFIHRWRKLLIGYAVVEGIIGLLAIVFHPIFTVITDLTFSHLLSGQGDTPLMVMAIKWGVASLLIFPQSVLLGMTFPLMVGGIMRMFPDKPGYTLSMLYFTNSIGAVFGVLASSFILIGWVGLPGTMLTAGLINLALALIVWSLAKNYEGLPAEKIRNINNGNNIAQTSPVTANVLLVIALLTGLSSFMYEIGWIRMLVLVLGGSTHSFELMLASFILGIALGGLWLRNRIDNIVDPRAFLGYVQLAMAAAAVLSVWLYHYSFDWMSMVLDIIQRKDSTYPIFLALSGVISAVIMLPATFCAGMTLPLITRLIIQTKKSENGIGYVYSANTLGAIVGIFLSVHVILPAMGLKNLIIAGAAVDLVLAFYLLRISPLTLINLPKTRLIVASAATLFLTASMFFADFNVNRLSSGVYRAGGLAVNSTVLFHEDGKTSTVTVSDSNLTSVRRIINNGKPDASIEMDPNKPQAADEDTQIMLGALPLFQKPEAKSAAVIGLGSGMSSHAILGSPNLEIVDTIEMEAKVIEGAKLFLPHVERVYNDTRSTIYVEDAKTFFSTHNKQYDIIVSEPPNPWVSGVATLFSQEFYQRIKKHLTDDGLFVQWIQLYEIDISLVALVFNALELEFKDYIVYRTDGANIVIMASADKMLQPISSDAFSFNELKPLLARSNINNIEDIEFNRIGSKQLLAPLFQQLSSNVNSDYFPLLDSGAPRARYAQLNAAELADLVAASVPVVKFLLQTENYEASKLTSNDSNHSIEEAKLLLDLRDNLLRSDNAYVKTSVKRKDEALEHSDTAVLFKHNMNHCDHGSAKAALESFVAIGSRMVALLSREEQAPFWNYIAESECISNSSDNEELVSWYKLFTATYQRQYENMSRSSTKLLKLTESNNRLDTKIYLLSTGLLGDVLRGDNAAATKRWQTWGGQYNYADHPHLPFLLLLSNLGIR